MMVQYPGWQLRDALLNTGEIITEAFAPLCMALENLNAVMAEVTPGLTDRIQAIEAMADEVDIILGRWGDVSSEKIQMLTPEQRWEYQKWVWGAPIRYLRRKFRNDVGCLDH